MSAASRSNIVNAITLARVALAWIFVLARYAHSFVHVTVQPHPLIAARLSWWELASLLFMWIWPAIWMVLT